MNNKSNCFAVKVVSATFLAGLTLTGFAAPNPASQDWVNQQIQNLKLEFQSQTTTSSPSIIGQSSNGGVVFFAYTDSTGTQHGLVAAPADEPGGAAFTWSATNASGSGQLQCANKSTGGYTDWRLPTKAEISALFNNRAAINPSDPNGGFDYSVTNASRYWSSTSAGAGFAWSQFFNFDSQGTPSTVTSLSVRCIRAF